MDASVVGKWLTPEPDRQAARDLENEEELIAPDFLMVEVANILWKGRLRGGIEPEYAHRGLRYLSRGVPALHETTQLVPRALDLALQLRHPIYDCLYLALALREDTAVVTADRRFHDRVRTSDYKGSTLLLGGE